MANMNVTLMTKKAVHGEGVTKLIVKRCPICKAKWVEPTEPCACTCPPKKATKKTTTDTNE